MKQQVQVHPGGDPAEATATLLNTYGPRLRAAALRMCGNAADADDLVQDVFLQAYRKWHTFRGDADPRTWLYAIAGRACRRRARRSGRRAIPAFSQLMPWSEAAVMAVAAAPDGKESESERREAIARVQAHVAGLPEHLRLPVVFKDMLGLSVGDTAESLGLAENTVKTRLHRARLALRKAMLAGGRTVQAPAPLYERQVCLDLLKAKLDAMDRSGTGGTIARFRVPQAEVCSRCRAVFRELDLVQDACAQMSAGELPTELRNKVLAAVRDRASRDGSGGPRRGRRPVQAGVAKRGDRDGSGRGQPKRTAPAHRISRRARACRPTDA